MHDFEFYVWPFIENRMHFKSNQFTHITMCDTQKQSKEMWRQEKKTILKIIA